MRRRECLAARWCTSRSLMRAGLLSVRVCPARGCCGVGVGGGLRAQARVKHRNITHVHGVVFSVDDVPEWIVMERALMSLDVYLPRVGDGALPLATFAALLADVFAGLKVLKGGGGGGREGTGLLALLLFTAVVPVALHAVTRLPLCRCFSITVSQCHCVRMRYILCVCACCIRPCIRWRTMLGPAWRLCMRT